MSIKAVTFDAYGTLLRNEDLRLVPSRIVADHGLSVSVDEVYRLWAEAYRSRFPDSRGSTPALSASSYVLRTTKVPASVLPLQRFNAVKTLAANISEIV